MNPINAIKKIDKAVDNHLGAKMGVEVAEYHANGKIPTAAERRRARLTKHLIKPLAMAAAGAVLVGGGVKGVEEYHDYKQGQATEKISEWPTKTVMVKPHEGDNQILRDAGDGNLTGYDREAVLKVVKSQEESKGEYGGTVATNGQSIEVPVAPTEK